MINEDFTFDAVFILTEDEKGDSIVFNTYEEFKEAYNLSNAELNKILEGLEGTPWGSGDIINGYMLKRRSSSKGGNKPKESRESVLKFRTSYDGDHWEYYDELFTSMPKLVDYVEAFIIAQALIPEEDVKAICERLLQDGYAKWVNPNDKKDKFYIHVQSEELDKLFLD